jgi:flagellar P-ring protein precursor FlgI
MGASVEKNLYKSKNVAAVMVTAELPPFIKSGQKIDVFVSSIGDSTTLKDGTLLMTPLKGPDGKVYAVAQGPVIFGGRDINNTNKKNETVCKVMDGGIIEKTVDMEFVQKNKLYLVLHKADFTTAMRIAEALEQGGYGGCKAIDPLTVEVPIAAENKDDVVKYVAGLEEFTVIPDTVAKVVINQRTGTVVVGDNVRLAPVAVSHGDFEIKIEAGTANAQDTESQQLLDQINQMKQAANTTEGNNLDNTAVDETAAGDQTAADQGLASAQTVQAVAKPPVSQPAKGALSRANEVVVKLVKLKAGTSLSSLVKALNQVGATPYDLVAIIQALKESGSLTAEVEVI